MSQEAENGLRIAVVDDSDFVRKTVMNILESNGFHVVGGASTPEKAIGLLNTTSANLFIIDVVMPRISGIEVSRFISEQNRDVFVIIMSSLNVESIIIESIATGAVDYLQKPFDEETLIKSVKRIESRINKG